MPTSNFSAGILQKLALIAREFTDLMAETIRSKNAPKAIIQHTSIESPQKKGGTFSVDVVIDTSDDAAPMAGAYEWGSGVHGDKGQTYTIPGMPWLVIPRERWPKYNPPPDVDPVVLRSVEHPGVKARPYIAPSIVKIIPKMKKTFAKEFKQAYLRGVPKVTVISAKK